MAGHLFAAQAVVTSNQARLFGNHSPARLRINTTTSDPNMQVSGLNCGLHVV
jgi:hypothetical protein